MHRLPTMQALCALPLALLLGGCENHLCDPSASSWGMQAGQGVLLDSTHWASSHVYDAWAPYPHNVTETFDYRPFFPNCDPDVVFVYLSPDQVPAPLPSTDGGNAGTPSNSTGPVGGNLAEYVGATVPGFVTIYNDSCADYFVRVVVECPAADAADAAAAPGDSGG